LPRVVSFVNKVTVDIDELRDRLAKKEHEVEVLRELIKLLSDSLALSGPADGRTQDVGSHFSIAGPVYHAGVLPEVTLRPNGVFIAAEAKVHEAAEAVLGSRPPGTVMHTAEIVKAMQDAGFKADRPHLHNAVFTAMMRRKDRFEKSGSGAWRLVPKEPE